MIFGFAAKGEKGSTNFGVVSANSESNALELIAEATGSDASNISMMSAEEALSQYDEVAFLMPAEG